MVYDLGFMCCGEGLGFRGQVYGQGQGLGFMVLGYGLGIQGLGVSCYGLGFMV